MADAVCRHLETILRGGDQPADKDGLPQRRILIFEMPIPGKGHKDVGDGKQKYGLHLKEAIPGPADGKVRPLCPYFITLNFRSYQGHF